MNIMYVLNHINFRYLFNASARLLIYPFIHTHTHSNAPVTSYLGVLENK